MVAISDGLAGQEGDTRNHEGQHRKTGNVPARLAFASAASVPEDMIVSAPSAALTVPPDTGASTKRCPEASRRPESPSA